MSTSPPSAGSPPRSSMSWSFGIPPAEYRRGRKPGEVPALLQAAAIAAGLAPEKISHSDDEQVAARMAIQKGRPDGLVVMLVGSGRSLLRTERSRHLQEGLT